VGSQSSPTTCAVQIADFGDELDGFSVQDWRILLGVADGMNRAKVGRLINAENIEASMWQT
jgi:hypothetical protein